MRRIGTSDGAAVDVTKARETPGPAGQAVIEVEGVSKWFGDVVAVSDVSFRVGPGVTGLLGPNGAGKTTLFKMMAGLVKPSTGTIRIFGRSLRSDLDLYRRVGLVGDQETIYPFLTGREFVQLNATLQRLPDVDAAVRRALATVEMEEEADRPMRGYSKGMRQRVKIAAALVHDPSVLILDEPLTGTDPLQRLHLIDLIRRLGEEGRTVVVSSHVLHEVERVADQILVIVNGKLAAAGDYHAIRDQIDERARTVRVRASDPRALASALVRLPTLRAIQIERDQSAVVVETDDTRALYRLLPRVARDEQIRLYEVVALDDNLSSVFAYVTGR